MTTTSILSTNSNYRTQVQVPFAANSDSPQYNLFNELTIIIILSFELNNSSTVNNYLRLFESRLEACSIGYYNFRVPNINGIYNYL